MTVEDALALKTVGNVRVSPDGRWVAYVVTVRDMERNVNDTDVWVVATAGGDPVRLTSGEGRDDSPEWSPDGRWIAFLSDRADEVQVFGIRPDGGEAWQVTDFETEIGDFAIAPDGSALAFIASPAKSEDDEELEKLRGRPMVWDSAYGNEWARLWIAPLAGDTTGTPQRVSPDTLHVMNVVWSPDSRAVAFAARPSPVLRTFWFAAVFVADSVGAPVRQVTTMEGGEEPVAWTEDLDLVVSGSGHLLDTYNYQLWSVSPVGGDPVLLTEALDEDATLVSAAEGVLLVEASYRTLRRLYRIPVSRSGGGTPEIISRGDQFQSGFSSSRDGAMVAFVGESDTAPPDVYVARAADFSPTRLTDVNPQIRGLALGPSRVASWQSRADAEPIEGVLTLPVGYQEGTRVPLLLVIHGGPAGVSSNRFNARGAYPVQVFAGLGYAVLQPNYRGSTGYGERFRGLNRGDISGRDWIDVDSGVDELIRLGIADQERLGIMGWSFGGHHTYWGITQTDRFAAASAGAGANDLISMYSQTDLPEFYHTYLGPRPWEDFDLYEERSAYRGVERVTTPLLIQVGERDERVPAEQSIQFFEAVRAIGKAPVKLVVYPGQPHGVRDPRLTRDLMSRNVEWFSRWIPARSEAASEGR